MQSQHGPRHCIRYEGDRRCCTQIDETPLETPESLGVHVEAHPSRPGAWEGSPEARAGSQETEPNEDLAVTQKGYPTIQLLCGVSESGVAEAGLHPARGAAAFWKLRLPSLPQ